MRKIVLFVVSVLFVFAGASLADDKPPSETRKPLAVVGGKLITARDVDARMAAELAEAERTLPAKELDSERRSIRAEGLNQLVEENLLTLEGHRLEKENKEVAGWADRQTDTILRTEAAHQGGQVTYQAQLAARGLTLKQERENIRDYVLRTFVVQRFINTQSYASPAEIRAYYNKHVQEFSVPRRVAYSQIFLPTADFESAQKARERADWIRRNLAPDGHDFQDWAKKYSKGSHAEAGDSWPLGEWSTTDEKLQAAILALKDNEISAPLEGPGGFYLFKIDSSVPTHTKTLLEVEPDIGRRILADKRDQTRTALIQRLRGQFGVRLLEAN